MDFDQKATLKTTFLLVDHHPEDLILVRSLFERAGDCQIHAVTDCQCAFDYLTGASVYSDRQLYPMPSLILLDLTRESFEFLEWLRQDAAEALRRLPVALLSTCAEPGDVEISRRLGVNSWLLKPAPKAMAA